MTNAIDNSNSLANQLTGTSFAEQSALLKNGTTSTGGNQNQVDKDMFLKLLVTQLKYQDPLNPSDPSQFLSQTAQFTSVEKLTALADQGVKTALATKMSTASSMIGKDVTYAGDGGLDTTSGVQTARIDDNGDIQLDLANGKSVNLTAVKSISQKTT